MSAEMLQWDPQASSLRTVMDFLTSHSFVSSLSQGIQHRSVTLGSDLVPEGSEGYNLGFHGTSCQVRTQNGERPDIGTGIHDTIGVSLLSVQLWPYCQLGV